MKWPYDSTGQQMEAADHELSHCLMLDILEKTINNYSPNY